MHYGAMALFSVLQLNHFTFDIIWAIYVPCRHTYFKNISVGGVIPWKNKMDNKCIWSWIWDIAMTPLLWKPLGHIRWLYNYFPYAEINKAVRGASEDVIPLFAIYLINLQCVMSDIYETIWRVMKTFYHKLEGSRLHQKYMKISIILFGYTLSESKSRWRR